MRKLKLLLVKIFKIGILTAIMGFTIYGAYKIGEVNVIRVEATVTDSMPAKIEELKDSVVDRLVKCESSGLKESDAPIILDSNKKFSIGVLQFQIKTVQHYTEIINHQTITAKEAVLLALDEQRARQLAKQIIFGTKSGVAGDWVVCSRRHNLQAEVDIIKKLSQ